MENVVYENPIIEDNMGFQHMRIPSQKDQHGNLTSANPTIESPLAKMHYRTPDENPIIEIHTRNVTSKKSVIMAFLIPIATAK